MNRLAFIGLMKIEFPAYTLRLCDGGFMHWGAETFTSADAVFGTIAGLDSLNEGVGDEVPVFELSLNPPSATAPATLSQPGYQTSRVRFWMAEYDVALGTLTGTPDLQYDGQIDQTILTFGRGQRDLAMTIVANTARLIERNIGNSLSGAWHKSIWPNETGHDNATGLGRQVAWGVDAPVAANNNSYSGLDLVQARRLGLA